MIEYRQLDEKLTQIDGILTNLEMKNDSFQAEARKLLEEMRNARNIPASSVKKEHSQEKKGTEEPSPELKRVVSEEATSDPEPKATVEKESPSIPNPTDDEESSEGKTTTNDTTQLT